MHAIHQTPCLAFIFISKESKIKYVYKTLIRLVVIYIAETCAMTRTKRKQLRVFERKILGTPESIRITITETRHIMNDEILAEMRREEIVKHIK